MDIVLFLSAGWPAILVSVVLAILGLVRSNSRLLIAPAVAAYPFSWVWAGFPLVCSPVLLTPALVFGAAWAIYRRREMLAWILGITFFLVIALFAGGT